MSVYILKVMMLLIERNQVRENRRCLYISLHHALMFYSMLQSLARLYLFGVGR